ncbi:hypothetical protein Lser_V15G18478 [Lactuca serriola]
MERGFHFCSETVKLYTARWYTCRRLYCTISFRTGRAFTAKGLQVLEYVGKEIVDLLIAESGMEVDKNGGEGGHGTEDDQLLEEITFNRCFYIYGGPEHLELFQVCPI